MRVLALASQKGGSGKTTLSGHLAVQAQLAGAGPVVLIDIDPQGSLADWWNERETDLPAFAQTTVARLASDLEILRQQGFKLAVIDTPPAITMAIQSVISVAELIVVPTRPSPHDLRAVGATVDLCERAGKPLVFVVNAATPKAKITSEAAVALSQHGTVAPVTLHHRTDYAASMIDGRTVMEVDPNSRSADEIRQLWSYINDRLEKNFRRTVFSAPMPAQPGYGTYDDLGWNDMGYDVDPQQSSEPARMVDLKPLLAGSVLDHNAAAEHAVDTSVGHELIAEDGAELTPADMGPLDPTPVDLTPVDMTGAPAADFAAEAVEVPEIVRQQESLIERVAAVARKVEARPEPKAKQDKAPRTQRAREKAAFTLRLDAERHLRLRLASAVTNRSAQTILTELLDDYLSALPEIDAMASRLPAARPLRKSA